MNKIPVGIQLYSVREEAEENLYNTLLELKNMGYDGVELAGLYGHSPEDIRKVLDELELTPISAHVFFTDFMEDLQGTVKTYQTIGCRYLAIPYLFEEFRYGTDNFQKVMEFIPQISKECKKAGIELLYHNHDFEFLKTKDGEYVLDYMYSNLPNDLNAELDTCWIKYSGEDPVKYVNKYSGRCPIVHLKDYKNEDPIRFMSLGKGVQEFEPILKECLKSEVKWVVVEQDSHMDYLAMEDVKNSREYLKTFGW